jgi:hypothetical protein
MPLKKSIDVGSVLAPID